MSRSCVRTRVRSLFVLSEPRKAACPAVTDEVYVERITSQVLQVAVRPPTRNQMHGNVVVIPWFESHGAGYAPGASPGGCSDPLLEMRRHFLFPHRPATLSHTQACRHGP